MLVTMEWKLWVLFSPCDDLGLFCSSGETIQHISGWKDEDNALKMNALKALVNKSISNEFVKKDVVFVPHNEDTLQQDKPDAYDKLVKEMALVMRARPSTETPEEITEEEKERGDLD